MQTSAFFLHIGRLAARDIIRIEKTLERGPYIAWSSHKNSAQFFYDGKPNMWGIFDYAYYEWIFTFGSTFYIFICLS
jgi:hypothetical protein